MSRTPSYRLHKPSGLGFIEIRGKRKYLGKYGTPESHRLYAKALTEYMAGDIGGADEEMACAVLIEEFLDFAETRYRKNGKPTTEVRAFTVALTAVLDLYAELPVNDFGPMKLAACRQWLLERGYCRKWINSYVGRIRRVWKWGVSREVVDEATWNALRSVDGLRKGEAPDLPPVEPVELARVNAIGPYVSPVVWGLIQFQLLTGCRPGEACAVRMCDLKMTGDVWEYRPGSYKTEHHESGPRRIVFIGPRAQAALRPFLRTDTHMPLFRPRDSKEWYLAKRRQRPKVRRKASPKRVPGDQYNAGSLGHAIRAACIKAGVEPWTPNQLRHTAATTIRASCDIESSRVVLGHSLVSTTEIYAAADQARAKEVARKLG